MDSFAIDVSACRHRQRRLIDEMNSLGLDAAVVKMPEHVQWLAGPRFPWTLATAAVLQADGHLTLCAPQREPEVAAVDQAVVFDAKWHSTLRNDQDQACHETLAKAVGSRLRGARLGVEFSRFGQYGKYGAEELVDIEPALYRLRRKKDADELALIRKAIAGTGRMYERAREIIRPGVSELEVFNELQAAAVNEFSEMMTGTGNDYQCRQRGGPPRGDRPAAAGELYILDLGPAFRGYFADNARTIAVSEPTDEQLQAWHRVIGALEHVQASVRPGLAARQLFREVQELLDDAPVGQFNHHLGHGIGLFPHEAPHLNPHWRDVFEEGEVFTAEPGLYAPELKAGIRIENDFLVTAEGVELLSDFPLELDR